MTPTSLRFHERGNDGFSLIELMVALLVLMVVSGTVLTGVMDMSNTHNTIMNRTDMHAGVRNATQLLAQEVGQAGRISLPSAVTSALGQRRPPSSRSPRAISMAGPSWTRITARCAASARCGGAVPWSVTSSTARAQR